MEPSRGNGESARGAPSRARVAGLVVGLIVGLVAPHDASAGCGCNKPPPPPAQVRPAVIYSGGIVTLFAPSLVAGGTYTVTFTSGVVAGAGAAVETQAIFARDLADAVWKPQIRVPLPDLPLGPASIDVAANGAPLLHVDDASFTVAPQPIALPEAYGIVHLPDFRAAVGRDGVVYVAFDLTALRKPMIFEARAVGYPLRFSLDDVVFHNAQGFLMQMLVSDPGTKKEAPIPGMFVFPAAAGSNVSDTLEYSRHEFVTYYLMHFENQPHAVDPSDPWWHLDGTPHVDHGHLVLSIDGVLDDGSRPQPGATPAFELVAGLYSLFNEGLVGRASVSLSGDAAIDSYDSWTGAPGSAGDVLSTGTVTLQDDARIDGSVRAARVRSDDGAQITGSVQLGPSDETFMQVKVPTELKSLGDVRVTSGTSLSVKGPGSFKLRSFRMDADSRLVVDNSAGPVTLYVTGKVKMAAGARVDVVDPSPERFAVYVVGEGPVELAGKKDSGPAFTGVLYAPDAAVTISGQGQFSGAFVGGSLDMSDASDVHYDERLRRPVE